MSTSSWSAKYGVRLFIGRKVVQGMVSAGSLVDVSLGLEYLIVAREMEQVVCADSIYTPRFGPQECLLLREQQPVRPMRRCSPDDYWRG